jgi:hypothetical protein
MVLVVLMLTTAGLNFSARSAKDGGAARDFPMSGSIGKSVRDTVKRINTLRISRLRVICHSSIKKRQNYEKLKK